MTLCSKPIEWSTDCLDARNPRLAALHRYWKGKSAERVMPSRADIDPVEMKEWLGNLVLTEFFGDVMHFRVRVDGSKLVEMGGGERTGMGLEVLTAEEERRILLSQYAVVLQERRP